MAVTPPPPVTELMLVSDGFAAPSSSVTLSAPPTPGACAPLLPAPPPPPMTESVTQQPATNAGGHAYTMLSTSVSGAERASGIFDAAGEEDGDLDCDRNADTVTVTVGERDAEGASDGLRKGEVLRCCAADAEGRCVPSSEFTGDDDGATDGERRGLASDEGEKDDDAAGDDVNDAAGVRE